MKFQCHSMGLNILVHFDGIFMEKTHGTVIEFQEWILSAAHCIHFPEFNYTISVAGKSDGSIVEETEQIVKNVDIIINEGFVEE